MLEAITLFLHESDIGKFWDVDGDRAVGYNNRLFRWSWDKISISLHDDQVQVHFYIQSDNKKGEYHMYDFCWFNIADPQFFDNLVSVLKR